ncbi:hypothetical protein [Deinococcus cellulosilyticus]|uniref:Uncharacterized protein n=1 Tax=Deinococcus cellulosilyticus (strain DSM 18568 / NBRC 106333 / KACC 11606 / 5516J-15) TaxID=1223518 RepID=A0A511N880_DEIC1|nr:hypothetical protein [Deinococcus cellulosilyticus]GEM48698.1 hypothetical protein DC3_43330 [Deinococcus cellulosilyticus NBRC 106333 = KACC 11606]
MNRKSTLPTVGFENADFDRLLQGPAAYRVAYKQAFLCPCYDKDSSGPEHNCQVCQGNGYYWVNFAAEQEATATFYFGSESKPAILPHSNATITRVVDEHGTEYTATLNSENRVEFTGPEPEFGAEFTVEYTHPLQYRLFAQGIKAQRMWMDRGEVETSDLQATVPAFLEDLNSPNPLWFASTHDRFVLLDVTKRYQQRMERRGKELLTYKQVEPLAARAKVNGNIVLYQPGSDFQVVNGEVKWVGTAPPSGSRYTLEYLCHPEYYVFNELAQARHMGGENQVRTLLLRLYELFPGRGK